MKFKDRYIKNNMMINGMIVLVLILFFSGYFGSIRFGFMDSGDLPRDLLEVSHSYYLSKFHIWFESFDYFGLVLLLIIPLIISTLYANSYFNRSDIYNVYRIGLNKYLSRKYFKAIIIGLTMPLMSLGIYWIILKILPTTNKIFVYGTLNEFENIISPVIIINSTVRELAIRTPKLYILLSTAIMTLGGASYAAFSMALGSFIRQKYARLIAPFLILLIVDAFISTFVFSLPDSLLLGIFNPYFSLPLSWLIIPSFVLLIISTLLIIIHYKQRIYNG